MVLQALAKWLLQADEFLEGVWPLVRAALWAVLAAATLAGVMRWNGGRGPAKVVRYRVRVPEVRSAKAAGATILERPSIRVPGEPGTIQCYAPATGQLLGRVPAATGEDIDAAVAAAVAAQKQWQTTTTLAQRSAVLASLLQHVLDNQKDICRVACADSGKLSVDAALGEVMVVAERIRWTMRHGPAALAPSRRPTHPRLLMPHKRNWVVYDEPLGVVAALVSWNYPFHNLVAPMVSAIFAGNGIVVKASEQTAWSSRYFRDLVRGALAAHGHDPALVQVVVCWPETAARLTRHADIVHITFIGSQPVARHVAADAAAALTPLCAELGGKDPFIVLDSVGAGRLPAIAETLLRGTFQASGQNCIGVERVIAGPAVYDTLLGLLVGRVQALRLGAPEDEEGGEGADVGAMISDASFDRLEALVQDAVARGARLLAGGRRVVHPRWPKGHYFAPTLLADVTPEMQVANEECFGPILVMMKVTTEAAATSGAAGAALAVANAPSTTRFGLGASVFGAENDPALAVVVAGVRAGMVAVNDFATYYAVQLPFGGVAGSGFGRFAGAEGLQALCNAKSICEDRWGWAGVRTTLPPAVRYPVASQARSWAFVAGLVRFGYGQRLAAKAKGLKEIIQNA